MDRSLLVRIFVPTREKGVGNTGTGYPVGRDLVLTARHVVEPPDRDPKSPIQILWYDYPNAGPDDGWYRLAEQFAALDAIPNNRQKLTSMLDLFLRAFEADPLLKELMLFESRRMRKSGSDVMLTRGYQSFLVRIDSILQDMAKRGELKPGLSPVAVRAALVGMMEGMLREQLLYQRHQSAEALDSEVIRKVFRQVFQAFLN